MSKRARVSELAKSRLCVRVKNRVYAKGSIVKFTDEEFADPYVQIQIRNGKLIVLDENMASNIEEPKTEEPKVEKPKVEKPVKTAKKKTKKKKTSKKSKKKASKTIVKTKKVTEEEAESKNEVPDGMHVHIPEGSDALPAVRVPRTGENIIDLDLDLDGPDEDSTIKFVDHEQEQEAIAKNIASNNEEIV